MKTKDFREIQVSSSLLAVIFLGVLALGVFIFLLGVSVGKKQVQVASGTKTVAQQIQDLPKEEPTLKPQPSASGDTAVPAATSGGGTAPKPAPGTETKAKPMPQEVEAANSAATKPATKPVTTKPPGKTETSPPPATAAPSGSGLYYVQVAAFKERPMAVAEADKYKKRGYTAIVTTPQPTDKTAWYRVRLGGFPTRDKAVDLLGKLNEAAKKKTDFVIIKD